MKILIDTHVLLWLLHDSKELSKSARKVLSDPDNEVFFSSMSLAEIALKHQLRPEIMPMEANDVRQDAIESNLEEIPFSGNHAICFGMLPFHHKDPFDRMLIAQAQAEGMRLLTHDHLISLYGPMILPC